ncbi:hypothetical protein SARC_07023 [Sphaeroforma arctica JP610]|uniref:DNA polymerase zeta catalytic subunit n=1 Tax=Sphaeroforma arctica JP610 TaxID=667725 RepID=A0A0L0FXE6_9EUKA|nr:hypothetical protein SARC_07023 [Sphaeroforma arctica JP610]KNC80613.1 hypothetical protein SARC_07023 [Sphaeroforma arctica JP610]|eukprot:XP_014154515.1 hypothetical protein SARC_07023 [Sphaeroforma arctica JP610]
MHIRYVESELQLLHAMVKLVGEAWDVDILVGFESQREAWGYLVQRADIKYSFNLCAYMSRTPNEGKNTGKREDDEYGFNRGSGVHVNGRYTISVWQTANSALSLYNTSYEYVVLEVLKRQTPKYLPGDLTRWYRGIGTVGPYLTRWRTLMYRLDKATNNLDILEKLNFIGQTSEEARVYGCQFYDVYIRGSQFKVEAMLARMTQTLGFIMPSPTPAEVQQQVPLQEIALNLEPQGIALNSQAQSGLYVNPVLVLDFQSLYPSLMIAYNLCYSTCLGRIANLERPDGKLGPFIYDPPANLVQNFKENVLVTPNGVMFVKPEVRRGVLPRLMKEILSTRVMVKNSMKRYRDTDAVKHGILHNRQYALKMIANVTYGYTSASYSGRMPCADIADSIVSNRPFGITALTTGLHSYASSNAVTYNHVSTSKSEV